MASPQTLVPMPEVVLAAQQEPLKVARAVQRQELAGLVGVQAAPAVTVELSALQMVASLTAAPEIAPTRAMRVASKPRAARGNDGSIYD